MDFLIVYIATLIHVALKAGQQLNVMHDKKRLVPLFSYGMAYCELSYGFLGIGSLISISNTSGYNVEFWLTFILVGLVMGTGGWNGCYISMDMHKNWRERT